MAIKPKRDNPLLWEDLAPAQQTGVESEINNIGTHTQSNVQTHIDKMHATAENPENKPTNRAKAAQKASSLESIKGDFTNTPITMADATQRRVDVLHRAQQSARDEGGTLPGSAWYFDHRHDITTDKDGLSSTRVIAAAAAFSPGKDPQKDELPAIRAAIDLHKSPHTVTDIPKGQTDVAWEIPSERLARLANRAKTEANPDWQKKGIAPSVESTYDRFAVLGRPHEAMLVKGLKAMRGEITPEEANPPLSGPKTASYQRSIEDAKDPMVELDYRGIAHHFAHGDPNQGMLMYSGSERTGRRNILSPDHDTAEDTWMQAVTSGQANQIPGRPGRSISPAKRAVDKGGPGEMTQLRQAEAGIKGDTSISTVGAVHAFNNRATRNAASEVGPVSFDQNGRDIAMPSVMAQETIWTQFRREGGGDHPWNQEQAARVKADAKVANFKAAASRQQQVLPGMGGV